jgi:hypothetical protein
MTDASVGQSDTDKQFRVKYIVDGRGRKTAAVLDIATFNKLIEYLEDLEDRLFIESLDKRKLRFRPYEEFRQELINEGLL